MSDEIDNIELRDNWKIVSIRDVCPENDKETLNPLNFPDEEFEYYSIPAFQEDRRPQIALGKDILSLKNVVDHDTVLYGKLNPRVIKVWRVDKQTNHKAITSTEFIPLVSNGKIDVGYLEFVCQSSFVVAKAQSMVSGAVPSRQRVDPASFFGVKIPLPPPPEQRAIAAILYDLRAAIEVQDKTIAALKDLKSATLAKVFREGLRGEPLKQTEIGEIPESWDVKTIGETAQVKGGKRLPKGRALTKQITGHPYLRVTDFSEHSIDLSDLHYLPEDIFPQIARYIIDSSDVYISIAGTIGLVGMIPDHLSGANLTENAARIIIDNQEDLLPRFVMYWLTGEVSQSDIAGHTVKNAQPKLALARIKMLKVPVPAPDEQAKMTKLMDDIIIRTVQATKKKRDLKSLFQSTLSSLMSGSLSVTPLLKN